MCVVNVCMCVCVNCWRMAVRFECVNPNVLLTMANRRRRRREKCGQQVLWQCTFIFIHFILKWFPLSSSLPPPPPPPLSSFCALFKYRIHTFVFFSHHHHEANGILYIEIDCCFLNRQFFRQKNEMNVHDEEKTHMQQLLLVKIKISILFGLRLCTAWTSRCESEHC